MPVAAEVRSNWHRRSSLRGVTENAGMSAEPAWVRLTLAPARKLVPLTSMVTTSWRPLSGESEVMESGGAGGVSEDGPDRMSENFWVLLVRFPVWEMTTC